MNKDNPEIQSIIHHYKSRIDHSHLQDEVYKWELVSKFKGRPDTNATDFAAEYKAVKFGNLVYNLTSAVGNHICRENPEAFRKLFVYLFDESISLDDRVNYFNEESLNLYRSIGGEKGHHQDERTISAYLTFHNPEKYTFYKNTFYLEFCKLMSVAPAGKNKNYAHYLELLNQFIDQYIVPDKQLIEQVKEYIPEYYDGSNHLLLAQDILYSMLDKKVNEQELNDEEDIEFEKFIKQFNPKDFGQFMDFAREIVNVHHLQIGDERLTFNYYDNRLVISVGQRYALGLYNKDKKHKFTVLSKDSFSDKGEEFDGENTKAFLNFLQDWNITDEQKVNIQEGIRNELKRTNRSGYHKHNKTDFEKYVFEHINKKGMSNSLNQILYGPPGTGKTYSTIDKVVEICAPGEAGNRYKNTRIYNRLVNEGRVIFTTFHQSMSYEDFIEGIKPIPPNKNSVDLQYEVKDGIFKKLCKSCLDEIIGLKYISDVSRGVPFKFDEKYDQFVKELLSGEIQIQTKTGLDVYIEISSNGNLLLSTSVNGPNYIVSKTRLKKLTEMISAPERISNIDESVRNVIGGCNTSLYYATLVAYKKFENNFKESIKDSGIEANLQSINLSYNEINQLPKYVLVIDEINRGNVSSIFGELITLIEEDKRFSRPNALFVELPYSQSKFSVPPNLYIIGTMNTADRSVEALDTALRRRFCFEEMLPNPELVRTEGRMNHAQGILNGIDLSLLLTTINKRIEKLLDKDHQIGHSYFMHVSSIQELKEAFQNKIIPLLQEYFFGDYGKIGLVLGQGFFEEMESSEDEKFFAEFRDYEIDGILDKRVYHIKNVNLLEDNPFIEIVKAILPRK